MITVAVHVSRVLDFVSQHIGICVTWGSSHSSWVFFRQAWPIETPCFIHCIFSSFLIRVVLGQHLRLLKYLRNRHSLWGTHRVDRWDLWRTQRHLAALWCSLAAPTAWRPSRIFLVRSTVVCSPLGGRRQTASGRRRCLRLFPSPSEGPEIWINQINKCKLYYFDEALEYE